MTGRLDAAKILRRALILLAGSALCAVIMIFVFTGIGAGMLFRLGVLAGLDDVDTKDTAHLEYYDVKQYIGAADSVRVYLNGEIEGSYTAALDFLKFVKQNADINLLAADIENTEGVNGYLSTGNQELLDECGLSARLRAFMIQLYIYNQSLPPQKRMSVVPLSEAGDGCYIFVERAYDISERAVGVMDISMIYPGTEGCDPLFDINSLILSGNRIRFGSADGLDLFVGVLDAVSGNFGLPEFVGVNQPEFYFLIENREDSADS